jgi:hypothetical protein
VRGEFKKEPSLSLSPCEGETTHSCVHGSYLALNPYVAEMPATGSGVDGSVAANKKIYYD